MSPRIAVLGCPVDVLSRDVVLTRCAGFLDGQTLQHVVTANPELLLHARHDPALRTVLGRAALVVPDGIGLVWALRWRGARVPQRITGVDLLAGLTALATAAERSVFLVGGWGGVATVAAEQLARTIHGAPVPRWVQGSRSETSRGMGDAPPGAAVNRTWFCGARVHAFASDHAAERPPLALWEAIEAGRPAVLAVGYGAPTQERWIAAHRARLEAAGVRVALGVGGAFDMLAGRRPRAPRVFRALGLEWLWRLMLEPRRLARILQAVILFPVLVIRDR